MDAGAESGNDMDSGNRHERFMDVGAGAGNDVDAQMKRGRINSHVRSSWHRSVNSLPINPPITIPRYEPLAPSALHLRCLGCVIAPGAYSHTTAPGQRRLEDRGGALWSTQ